MKDRQRTLALFLVVLFAAGVFAADLRTPHGVAEWVLYLPLILASVWFNRPLQVVLVSAGCSVLVIAGFWCSPPGAIHGWDLLNRGMGLAALWLTALAGVIICRRSTRLAESQDRLRLLQRQMLEIAGREQRRIGQELHDGIGQELTGLGLMAGALADNLHDDAVNKRIAARLVAGLDQVHREVRALSHMLVPVVVESQGLWAALDELAVRATEQAGIPVAFMSPWPVEVPNHATATQLFRIAQEAVSNALRHGQARHVKLSLLSGPDGLRLSIEDDGTGMPAANSRRGGIREAGVREDEDLVDKNGIGLQIMQYRAEQIGAALQIGPAARGGTIVSCLLSRSDTDDGDEPGPSAPGGANSDRG